MTEKVGFDKTAPNFDLYGGVGLFSGALAAKYGTDINISSVEAFKRATDDAVLNLGDLSKAKVVCAQVDRFLQDQQRAKVQLDSATVVLDPPRAGAGAKVIDLLTNLKPKHIVYVACDPVALARDLKGLLAGGYELQELRAFDLFPHTHHVEAIASLVRKQ
jgi:tRNA/tmRNA/rRNA uracil-C5-methylase (TrmA/RlmC/RlmD family)